MSDKFYQDQLKNFGVDAVQIPRGGVNKEASEEHRRNMLSVTESLMSDMKGREWMYEQLSILKVFTVPFVPGQPDVSNFFCGLQAYGHKLQNDIMIAAPKQYHVMIEEEAARKVARSIKNDRV